MTVVGEGEFGDDADFYGNLATMPKNVGIWHRCRKTQDFGAGADFYRTFGAGADFYGVLASMLKNEKW